MVRGRNGAVSAEAEGLNQTGDALLLALKVRKQPQAKECS